MVPYMASGMERRCQVDKFFNILALIVYLGIIATVVGSPLTRGIITALGDAFSNALKAAKGR